MSSFTLKGKPFDHAPVASVSSSALTPTSSNASLVVDTPSTAPICVNSTPDFSEHHASTSTDDWGELENGIDEEPENDKGAWEDLEPLEETKPTPALTNIQAAQRPPVSQPVSQTIGTSLRPKTTPKMCKDEDDDLCGASAAPAPKTSKPLNLKSTAADAAAAQDTTAAPAPTTRAKPLLAGRCRGAKPAAPKLGAQRIIRTPSGV
ncbi:hypothetical protein MtrunA17_Chr1g0189451 [Medicago truncatula]|uniref:ARM repeat kinase family protein n=2 Tax=Medicago truncatula TaxID=3880 RepID=A0A072VNH3_MEDTR|nr:ARM repeat kinase family protein [Medicago truncatula]RHN80545.1 hypothetical protein MtrunA17_Chr1g0189451 [Medicago truncatula]